MITDNGKSRACGAWLPGHPFSHPGLVENPGLQDHLEHSCRKATSSEQEWVKAVMSFPQGSDLCLCIPLLVSLPVSSSVRGYFKYIYIDIHIYLYIYMDIPSF